MYIFRQSKYFEVAVRADMGGIFKKMDADICSIYVPNKVYLTDLLGRLNLFGSSTIPIK
jgi:hypothetical protein